jgi:hypothetical protein
MRFVMDVLLFHLCDAPRIAVDNGQEIGYRALIDLNLGRCGRPCRREWLSYR